MTASSIAASLFLSLSLALTGCGDDDTGSGVDAGPGTMDAGPGTMDAGPGTMDAGSPSCSACSSCFEAVQAACAICPTDMDCDAPEDPCASAMMLEGMVGCTACAASAMVAICM